MDFDTGADALSLVKTLGDDVVFYKVGLQLFMERGFPIVAAIVALGKKVFLDLKINDTPRTVEQAVRMSANAEVALFTLQGNAATTAAARLGRGHKQSPRFLQVTYLSSWDASVDIDEQVLRRTENIIASGCDGVIASGTSVAKLRARYPDLLIVTPGIRPAGASTDDHKRSLTPADAIIAGASYIVVGRPIRDAADPKAAAAQIQDEIVRAMAREAA